jgi:hypothetical protein
MDIKLVLVSTLSHKFLNFIKFLVISDDWTINEPIISTQKVVMFFPQNNQTNKDEHVVRKVNFFLFLTLKKLQKLQKKKDQSL